jgi:hypothetical protein
MLSLSGTMYEVYILWLWHVLLFLGRSFSGEISSDPSRFPHSPRKDVATKDSPFWAFHGHGCPGFLLPLQQSECFLQFSNSLTAGSYVITTLYKFSSDKESGNEIEFSFLCRCATWPVGRLEKQLKIVGVRTWLLV